PVQTGIHLCPRFAAINNLDSGLRRNDNKGRELPSTKKGRSSGAALYRLLGLFSTCATVPRPRRKRCPSRWPAYYGFQLCHWAEVCRPYPGASLVRLVSVL